MNRSGYDIVTRDTPTPCWIPMRNCAARCVHFETRRQLTVHDGWRYFVLGWSEVVAEVFDVELPLDRFQGLVRIADVIRK